MDKLAEKIAELSDRLGPHVVDAARGAARMEAISTLAAGIVCALATYVLTRVALYLWRLETDHDDVDFARLGAVFLFIGAFGTGCSTIWQIVDPWIWSTLSNPDLWIAKRVLGL